MPTMSEALGSAQTQQNALLEAGISLISANQSLTFIKYVRLVLPLDGFVFWVRSDLINPQYLLGLAKLNAVQLNQGAGPTIDSPDTITVGGAVHYGTQTEQRVDETISINSILFSAKDEVQDLNEVSSDYLYLATFEGVRFAFSGRRAWFQQAGIYHYQGKALYPALASQVIDSAAEIDTRLKVVSNSLPVWMALNKFMPMYPSYAVPSNAPPPYAVIDIPSERTEAIQASPHKDASGSLWQLASDEVKIITYGLRNDALMDFREYVEQYSYTDVIGIMNMPIIRDEKRTQNELNILAMKKSITFKVSYYQSRINDVARQLILSCIPSYNF